MDSTHERVSLQPGGDSPWLNLIRATAPTAAIATLSGAGHFPQIEQADTVAALIARFVWPEGAS
jgi:pimeloyl-ACP methyl ester carboxylesterase